MLVCPPGCFLHLSGHVAAAVLAGPH